MGTNRSFKEKDRLISDKRRVKNRQQDRPTTQRWQIRATDRKWGWGEVEEACRGHSNLRWVC